MQITVNICKYIAAFSVFEIDSIDIIRFQWMDIYIRVWADLLTGYFRLIYLCISNISVLLI
jgi:hypothetical protein